MLNFSHLQTCTSMEYEHEDYQVHKIHPLAVVST